MQTPLDKIGRVPFGLAELATLYPHISDIKEKARRLEMTGRIIRLKQGLYVRSQADMEKPLATYLVANHLNGPSYVSMLTALRYYGLTPEGVYMVQSMTIHSSCEYQTPIGRFTYRHVTPEYMRLGITMQKTEDISFLMATKEKALCDLMATTPHLSLRYMKDMRTYLEEDIRFDMDELDNFNIDLLREIAAVSTKPVAIRTLIKWLSHE